MKPFATLSARHSFRSALPTRSVTVCLRHMSLLAQKVEPTTRPRPEAVPLQHDPRLQQQKPQRQHPDPYALAAEDLTRVRQRLLNMLGSAHPGLAEIAKYYFLHPSKQIRSLVVLLFSQATNGLGRSWAQKDWDATWEVSSGEGEELDRPLKQSNILNERNSTMPDHTGSFATVFSVRQATPRSTQPPLPQSSHLNSTSSLARRPVSRSSILPTQLRLAQIMEMIHIASLLHDHIEPTASEVRPPAQDSAFGNKLAILGGDFLLGRASTSLSHLGESEVVELVASVISNLVEGEFLRMQEIRTPELGVMEGPSSLPQAWESYLRKTYLKTASLMAKGARSAVILGGCQGNDVWKEASYAYGRNLGIASQLWEDAVENIKFQGGIATGPILFAAEERPELLPFIRRNFSQEDDISSVLKIVKETSGVERTRTLAVAYAEKARQDLELLPPSESKDALIHLTHLILKPESTW